MSLCMWWMIILSVVYDHNSIPLPSISQESKRSVISKVVEMSLLTYDERNTLYMTAIRRDRVKQRGTNRLEQLLIIIYDCRFAKQEYKREKMWVVRRRRRRSTEEAGMTSSRVCLPEIGANRSRFKPCNWWWSSPIFENQDATQQSSLANVMFPAKLCASEVVKLVLAVYVLIPLLILQFL